MSEQGPNRPLTAAEGLELARLVRETTESLRRLNRSLFGEDAPSEKEIADGPDGAAQWSQFGHDLGVKLKRVQEKLDELEAAIKGGGKDGSQ